MYPADCGFCYHCIHILGLAYSGFLSGYAYIAKPLIALIQEKTLRVFPVVGQTYCGVYLPDRFIGLFWFSLFGLFFVLFRFYYDCIILLFLFLLARYRA